MSEFAYDALRLAELLAAGGLASVLTYRLSTFLTGTKTGPRA